MNTKKIRATLLSLALLVPVGSAVAQPNYYSHHHYYRHRHHYSQTRGAVIGAVAGAAIDHRQPLKGALIGGAVGEGVQMLRNHNQKH
jgi:hypothetical protein